VYGETIETGARLATGPASAQESHRVTARGDPAEDLVQVDLGPAGLWVLAVLPVDQQDAH
jgi:hypothetical protein